MAMKRHPLPHRRSSRPPRPPLPEDPTDALLEEYIGDYIPWADVTVPLRPEAALVRAALEVVRTLKLFDDEVWKGVAPSRDGSGTADQPKGAQADGEHSFDLKVRSDLPKDGITNSLVRVWVDGDEEGAVLVRAYGSGTDKVIDRKQEIKNLLLLSANKLAPPLHGRFPNGLVYGYVSGRVTTVKELQDPIIMPLIATCVARLHKVTVRAGVDHSSDSLNHKRNGNDAHPDHSSDGDADVPSGGGQLFPTIVRWCSILHPGFQFPQERDTIQFEREVDLVKVKAQVLDLLPRIAKLKSPIIFSHNDLLSGNFIYDPSPSGSDPRKDAGRITVIDYEYASMAPRGFDIGNHFNEMMGFELDPELWPTSAVQSEWCSVYLQEWDRLCHGVEASPPDTVERLVKEANAYSLLSHLYWGLWALVQASISSIEFPYMQYAVDRFRLFASLKEERLKLAGL